MKLFDYDSKFNRFMNKTGDYISLNLVFLVSSLGIITIGASSTALYYCLFKMNEGKGGEVLPMFFRAFKANFKQSTVLLLCMMPAFAVLVLEISFLLSRVVDTAVLIFFIVSIMFIGGALSYVFPLQSKFENSVDGTLKNSIILSVTNMHISLPVLALNLVLPLFLLLGPGFLLRTLIFWVFFAFSLGTSVKVRLLQKVFVQHYPDSSI